MEMGGRVFISPYFDREPIDPCHNTCRVPTVLRRDMKPFPDILKELFKELFT